MQKGITYAHTVDI